MDWALVLENLKYTGIGAALFVTAYAANMLFGIYKNVYVLKFDFDWHKILNSALKIIAVGVGCVLISTTIVLLPEFATTVGWEIPEDFANVFQAIAIIGIFLYSTCKYVFEAIDKLKSILDASTTPVYKKDEGADK